jgi:hypothetical protein
MMAGCLVMEPDPSNDNVAALSWRLGPRGAGLVEGGTGQYCRLLKYDCATAVGPLWAPAAPPGTLFFMLRPWLVAASI